MNTEYTIQQGLNTRAIELQTFKQLVTFTLVTLAQCTADFRYVQISNNAAYCYNDGCRTSVHHAQILRSNELTTLLVLLDVLPVFSSFTTC